MAKYPSVIAENSRNRLLFSFRSRCFSRVEHSFLSMIVCAKKQPLSVRLPLLSKEKGPKRVRFRPVLVDYH